MNRRNLLGVLGASIAALGGKVLGQINLRDVPGSTHAESIKRIVSLGIMKGYSDNTFRPNEPITRGQVATVISNLLDSLEETGKLTFVDREAPTGENTYSIFGVTPEGEEQLWAGPETIDKV